MCKKLLECHPEKGCGAKVEILFWLSNCTESNQCNIQGSVDRHSRWLHQSVSCPSSDVRYTHYPGPRKYYRSGMDMEPPGDSVSYELAPLGRVVTFHEPTRNQGPSTLSNLGISSTRWGRGGMVNTVGVEPTNTNWEMELKENM
ncbi:hypothetical protein Pcinc_000485 [Petrolisthes cinctipes]|uniref:Uncharacterized protein n=1 Tax=Petrolisthes cinctipes TaxID=88211 RepID=A0AAE1GNB4_PETCI|nr:hypothetical protein Pcinc_000485 [Petrolisthes cinctipes]